MKKRLLCRTMRNAIIMHRAKNLSGPFFQNTGQACVKSVGNYYAPGMPGSGVSAYAGEVTDSTTITVYFTACVNVTGVTGVEYQVNGGAWTQVSAVNKVSDTIYEFTTGLIDSGDTVYWRYIGGSGTIVDCAEAEDIGDQLISVNNPPAVEMVVRLSQAASDGTWKALVEAVDGTETYSERDTKGTIVNSDGNVQELPPYSVRPKGARVVENLLESTENFDDAVWQENGSAVIVDNGGVGTITGLSANGANNIRQVVYETAVSVTGRRFATRMEIRGEGADIGKSTRVSLARLVGGVNPSNVFEDITLTGEWQILSVIPDAFNTDNTGLRYQIYGSPTNPASGCQIRYPQVEETTFKAVQDAPSEYVSVGALADDGLFHGLGVASTKAFATSAHNNSVANGIVTEGTPSGDISGSIYDLREPAATNYTDGDDDLSGGAETVDLTAAGTGDYTLSLRGTAAVTVAAGTAVGTGFGQATEGNDITFNLSSAGTVTLTLDSGTLDKVSGQAIKQVEKNAFSTSWISTSGAAASRSLDSVYYDSLGNHNQDEGVVVVKVKLSRPSSELDANKIIFGLRTGTSTVLFHNAAPAVRTYDGVNSGGVSFSSDAGDEVYFVVRWDAVEGKMQTGFYNITQGGSWDWSVLIDYDGAYVDDGFIYTMRSPLFPVEIATVEAHQSVKSIEWIEARYT